MAVDTSNLYGNITISRRAIRTVAGIAALECYGVWGVGQKKVIRDANGKFRIKNGVRVWMSKNKIGIYIDLILCFGVAIDATIAAARNAIKYNIENFTGMEVLFVDIRVMGIRK